MNNRQMGRSGQGGRWAVRGVALAAALGITLAAGLGLAVAGTEKKSSTPSPRGLGESTVDRFYGEFEETIPIEVPKFHGIEPAIALSYSSTGGNGFVGVGWTLSGFSKIERASPGKGAPRYDANDIWLLDGQELVPCIGGSVSPSCTTGGTHSTRIENYERIKKETDGTWTLTSKDGTQARYISTMSTTQAAQPIYTCTTTTTQPVLSGAISEPASTTPPCAACKAWAAASS